MLDQIRAGELVHALVCPVKSRPRTEIRSPLWKLCMSTFCALRTSRPWCGSTVSGRGVVQNVVALLHLELAGYPLEFLIAADAVDVDRQDRCFGRCRQRPDATGLNASPFGIVRTSPPGMGALNEVGILARVIASRCDRSRGRDLSGGAARGRRYGRGPLLPLIGAGFGLSSGGGGVSMVFSVAPLLLPLLPRLPNHPWIRDRIGWRDSVPVAVPDDWPNRPVRCVSP